MSEDRNDMTIGEMPTRAPGENTWPEPEPRKNAEPETDWQRDPSQTIGELPTQGPKNPELTMLAKRYRVLYRLGEGGMGSVWLAEDTKLDNRKVAVKMLPAVLAGKKAACKQVKQEALMAMKLSHPNIATVRAFEEEGGNPFLVMDYIEGTGLDDILSERGKLAEAETLKLLAPVAAALGYAHERGVVHRDVKPGNVMVAKDGTPFVLDFGVAREIQETMTRVTGKFSSGTLTYMSPEQLRGRAPKPAQDVYSFAAMAYECLGGMPPFSRGQIEYQIVNEPPEPLAEGVASKALREGIMAGLAKEPGQRPGSCAGVLAHGGASHGGASRPGEPDKGTTASRPASPEGSPHQQEATEAERAVREAEARAEVERAARKAAEAEAREARRRAQAEQLESQRAQEARGRATGWAWFLFVVLLVGVMVAYGWWQQEHETTREQVRHFQSEADAQRKARQEAEAKWKADAEAQRQAQAEAERKAVDAAKAAADARQALERQLAETARQLAEAKKKAQQPVQSPARAEPGGGGASRPGEPERSAVTRTVAVPPAPTASSLGVGSYQGEPKTIQLPGGATMEMVWCPAGGGTMGSTNGGSDEKPPHEVTLTKGFWMAKTEVTQGQWKSVMGSNPAHFQKGDNYPVESVSWDEAQEFCRKTGLSLPTEAEWEYACRAGTTGDYAGSLDQMAWYGEDWDTGSTHPVGTKKANAWGVHDMHGNVWEWCEDWYDSGYYGKSPGVNPKGPASGEFRVLRGGSCWGGPLGCRSAYRFWSNPGYRCWNNGFRPVARQD